jgi:formate dehydrogenase subunit gamma
VAGRSTPGSPERAELPEHILRFAGATRAFHWVHAVPFLFLLLTGLLLLIPEVKAVHVGGHRLVALLHVLAGIGLIGSVPLLYVLVRDRRALHEDLRLALTPEPGDGAWARYAVSAALGAKLPEPPSGKYNLGQKLSSAFWVAVTAGLMATGAVLAVNYFTKRVFSAAFVEQVFPWHDVLAFLSIPVLAAHLYLALVNPATRPSLRGILTGRVDAAWARRHHARWAGDATRRG